MIDRIRRSVDHVVVIGALLTVGGPATFAGQARGDRDTVIASPALVPRIPLPAEDATRSVTRFSFIAYGDTRGPRDGRDLKEDHGLVIESMLGTIKKSAREGDWIRFVLQSGDAVANGAIARQLTVSYIPLINRRTQDGGVPYFLAVGNHDVGSSPDPRSVHRVDGLHNCTM